MSFLFEIELEAQQAVEHWVSKASIDELKQMIRTQSIADTVIMLLNQRAKQAYDAANVSIITEAGQQALVRQQQLDQSEEDFDQAMEQSDQALQLSLTQNQVLCSQQVEATRREVVRVSSALDLVTNDLKKVKIKTLMLQRALGKHRQLSLETDREATLTSSPRKKAAEQASCKGRMLAIKQELPPLQRKLAEELHQIKEAYCQQFALEKEFRQLQSLLDKNRPTNETQHDHASVNHDHGQTLRCLDVSHQHGRHLSIDGHGIDHVSATISRLSLIKLELDRLSVLKEKHHNQTSMLSTKITDLEKLREKWLGDKTGVRNRLDDLNNRLDDLNKNSLLPLERDSQTLLGKKQELASVLEKLDQQLCEINQGLSEVANRQSQRASRRAMRLMRKTASSDGNLLLRLSPSEFASYRQIISDAQIMLEQGYKSVQQRISEYVTGSYCMSVIRHSCEAGAFSPDMTAALAPLLQSYYLYENLEQKMAVFKQQVDQAYLDFAAELEEERDKMSQTLEIMYQTEVKRCEIAAAEFQYQAIELSTAALEVKALNNRLQALKQQQQALSSTVQTVAEEKNRLQRPRQAKNQQRDDWRLTFAIRFGLSIMGVSLFALSLLTELFLAHPGSLVNPAGLAIAVAVVVAIGVLGGLTALALAVKKRHLAGNVDPRTNSQAQYDALSETISTVERDYLSQQQRLTQRQVKLAAAKKARHKTAMHWMMTRENFFKETILLTSVNAAHKKATEISVKLANEETILKQQWQAGEDQQDMEPTMSGPL